MRRGWIAAALIGVIVLLVAGPLRAQTTTGTVAWTTADTVANAQAFTYTWKDGSAAAVNVTAVTCSGSPTACTGTIPSPTPGAHSYVLSACSATMGCANAVPLVGNTPNTPGGVKIQIIVTVP